MHFATDLPFGGKYAFDWALCGQSTVSGPNRMKCSLISSVGKEADHCSISEKHHITPSLQTPKNAFLHAGQMQTK